MLVLWGINFLFMYICVNNLCTSSTKNLVESFMTDNGNNLFFYSIPFAICLCLRNNELLFKLPAAVMVIIAILYIASSLFIVGGFIFGIIADTIEAVKGKYFRSENIGDIFAMIIIAIQDLAVTFVIVTYTLASVFDIHFIW
jgi:hypothetical protein